MIKKFLNWIKNIFKPRKQEMDAHEELYTVVPESDTPVHVEETAKQKKIRLKHKGESK
tara:strand:+ start:374 stop:547 length:174 start_codon:yes stop_codon:yes gene_type:complete